MRRKLSILALAVLLIILGLWAFRRAGFPEERPTSVRLAPEPTLDEVMKRLPGQLTPGSRLSVRTFRPRHLDPQDLASLLADMQTPEGFIEIHQPSGSVIVVEPFGVLRQMDIIAEMNDTAARWGDFTAIPGLPVKTRPWLTDSRMVRW